MPTKTQSLTLCELGGLVGFIFLEHCFYCSYISITLGEDGEVRV